MHTAVVKDIDHDKLFVTVEWVEKNELNEKTVCCIKYFNFFLLLDLTLKIFLGKISAKL